MDSEELGDIIAGLSDQLTHPDRPFSGQPWTCFGKRGKTEIKGVRFRDLSDCVCRAMVRDFSKSEVLKLRADDHTLNYNDLYGMEFDDMDPLALIQAVCCEVERFMGIFPNVK